MIINTDIFNDMLLFIIHKNTNLNQQIIGEIIDCYRKQPILNKQHNKIYEVYINIINDIIEGGFNKKDNKHDLNVLFNKYKSNVDMIKRKAVLESIKHTLGDKQEISDGLFSIVEKKLTNIVTWHRCNEKVRNMFGYINNIYPDSNNEHNKKYFNKIIQMNRDVESSIRTIQNKDTAYIERIISNKRKTIKDAFLQYKERNITGSVRTGLQGLNKMCGGRGSFKLGESVMFCALTHNFKSMMLLSVARWIKDNNIFENKKGKKPLVLFISLENEAHENLLIWYKRVYHALTNEYDITSVSEDEVIDKIYEYFDKSNITFVIDRYLPGEFGYDELVNLINSFEDQGYYVVSCIIDYLSQMKKSYENNMNSGGHTLIKNLYNSTCNFLKSKGILFFTGHQLNRDASNIVATGIPYPVKRFSESHLADAMDVGREVDFIIYLHIEKNQLDEVFLTMKWGKHRYVDDTKEIDKFCAYKFSEFGIPDDVDKEIGYTRNIYTKNDNNKKSNDPSDSTELNIY